MSDACVTDSFARAKEAWSGLIRSPYPDGGASSGSYPPVQSLGHGRGRCQSRTRVAQWPLVRSRFLQRQTRFEQAHDRCEAPAVVHRGAEPVEGGEMLAATIAD